MYVWNLISLSTGILYIIPIILYIYNKQKRHIVVLFGLIGTLLSSEFIKRFLIGQWSPRPIGANNCNMLCDDGNQSGKPGMPSSHTAITSFFVVYYIQQTNNIWIQLFLILFLLSVMSARYIKRCHTIYQIGVGFLYGGLLAQITRTLIK